MSLIVFKMGQTRPLFVNFRAFHNEKVNIAQIWLQIIKA